MKLSLTHRDQSATDYDIGSMKKKKKIPNGLNLLENEFRFLSLTSIKIQRKRRKTSHSFFSWVIVSLKRLYLLTTMSLEK